MRYAIVDRANGEVTNICLWDGVCSWSPPENMNAIQIADNLSVNIGDSYDTNTNTFTPGTPAPVSDPNADKRAALSAAGFTDAQIDAILLALS